MYQGAEDKLLTSVMQIDQSAAFDVVSHRLLLEKMQRYNIGEGARKWILNYLSYRSQYVKIGRSHSKMVPATRGVPQGSVIGPLFFLIFTNEMTEVIKQENCQNLVHTDRKTLWGKQCQQCGLLIQYADDITYVTGNKIRAKNQQNLSRNLQILSEHLQNNQLSINQSKTSLIETMIFQKKAKTPGQPPTLVTMDDLGQLKTVKDSSSIRVLGGNIQGNMSWQAHLETGSRPLLPNIRQQIGRLKHLGKLIPLRYRKNIGKGLVVSKLNYLLPLWGGGATANYINKAQRVLNTTARWMTGLPKSTKILTLMKAADLMTIREQTRISTAVQTWKIVHLNKPQRLRARMEVTQDTQIEVVNPRLQFTTSCYRWRAAAQWNDLDQDLRQETSISRFKSRMKRLVLDSRPGEPDVPD